MVAWIRVIVDMVRSSPFGAMFLKILLMDWRSGARGIKDNSQISGWSTEQSNGRLCHLVRWEPVEEMEINH